MASCYNLWWNHVRAACRRVRGHNRQQRRHRILPHDGLGLNESVSMQTMTVTIQALRSQTVTSSWFKVAFLRELRSAVLLGLGCGALVVMIVLLWRKELTAAFAIGGSIGLSLVTACLFGLGIPSLLHSLKLDPKIAAGPVTLAITDFVALALYFGIAALVL